MSKEQEKELIINYSLVFVERLEGLVSPKNQAEIGIIFNDLLPKIRQQDRDKYIKGLEERILKIVQECRHDVILTNDMVFNGFIKDLEIKQVKICRFNEFEFADKISKIIKELKDE